MLRSAVDTLWNLTFDEKAPMGMAFATFGSPTLFAVSFACSWSTTCPPQKVGVLEGSSTLFGRSCVSPGE